MTKTHVLLIGIDAYALRPLRGCVNDIDTIQRLLLGPRVGLSPQDITRLASPVPGAAHETTIPEAPATLDNIRKALVTLGSEAVAEGERVFIYYSGHGARTRVMDPGGAVFYRESLVPADFAPDAEEPQLLVDFEMNRLLATIAARTRAITLCLDCCHASGVTREGVGLSPMVTRGLDPADLAPSKPIRLRPDWTGLDLSSDRGVAGDVEDCLVAMACLDHELAKEAPAANGVIHGVFSDVFLKAIDDLPAMDLRDLPWSRVWQAVLAGVESRNQAQHPQLAGSLGRMVFGGPPVSHDAGFPVTKKGDSSFEIGAGSLASVTLGAVVGVYGNQPSAFPSLGSKEDLAARAWPPSRS